MEITLLGRVVIPLVLLTALLRPDWLVYEMILLAPMQAAAVVNVPAVTFGLQPGYFVALCWLVRIWGRALLAGRTRYTLAAANAFVPLWCFVAWALLSALLLPRILEGQVLVYPPEAGLYSGAVAPLVPSRVNLTQWLYLLFVVLVAWSVPLDLDTAAKIKRASWAFVASGVTVVAWGVYQVIAFYAGWPIFETLFYNNMGFSQGYGQTIAGSLKRMSSFLGEPSMAAHFLAGFAGFCLGSLLPPSQPAGSAQLRRASLLVMALALAALIATTASTAIVTLLLWLGVLAGYELSRVQRWPRAFKLGAVVACVAALVLGAWAQALGGWAEAWQSLRGITVEKTASISGVERLRADAHAYRLVVESYGLGVGWGSNRPSSLLASLLSNAGIPGVTMLFWAVMRVRRLGRLAAALNLGDPDLTATRRCSLLAVAWITTAGVVGVPDLMFLYYWILIGLALAAYNVALLGAHRLAGDSRPLT